MSTPIRPDGALGGVSPIDEHGLPLVRIKLARPALRRTRLPINRIATPGKGGWTEMVARVVVGVIAPWNDPLSVYFKPVLPALLCGNSVVLKPSEYDPRTGARFAALLGDVLADGVVTVVQGGRDVGQALVASVDAVSFTGSPAGGRAVMAACAERLIPCSAELGGKDAAIVLADCALERTVLGVLNWGMHNGGQDCGAIERVYVEDAIAERFTEMLVRAAARLSVPRTAADKGDAAIGPLANPMQLAIVEEHVADAVAQGARLRVGGKRTGVGLFFEPTILDGCTHAMKVIAEETFGPVLAVVRVKDAGEAVRLANDSRDGLTASIWTGDIARAEQLAARLQVARSSSTTTQSQSPCRSRRGRASRTPALAWPTACTRCIRTRGRRPRSSTPARSLTRGGCPQMRCSVRWRSAWRARSSAMCSPRSRCIMRARRRKLRALVREES